MLGEKFTLEILPQFEADLGDAVDYIQLTLRNPTAANNLVDDVFAAIYQRLETPLAFSPYPSRIDRAHPYYFIPVGNYLVLYVVLDHVMEVRRFIYQRRNWQSWGL